MKLHKIIDNPNSYAMYYNNEIIGGWIFFLGFIITIAFCWAGIWLLTKEKYKYGLFLLLLTVLFFGLVSGTLPDITEFYQIMRQTSDNNAPSSLHSLLISIGLLINFFSIILLAQNRDFKPTDNGKVAIEIKHYSSIKAGFALLIVGFIVQLVGLFS